MRMMRMIGRLEAISKRGLTGVGEGVGMHRCAASRESEQAHVHLGWAWVHMQMCNLGQHSTFQ